MAVTKEAIAIVLDVGSSMKQAKENESIIQQAVTCVSLIIQRKIFSESKDEIALVIFGTDESDSDDEKLEHMKVVQDLKTADWELLEYVNSIESSLFSSDHLKEDALLLGISLLRDTPKKFFSKRILFISLFDSQFGSSKFDEITNNLKLCKIDLNLIGPVTLSSEDVKLETGIDAFVDGSSNYLQDLLKEVNGESYSFSEAIPALICYQKKKVQAIPWNANLDIGTNLQIPISAYTKVNESKPKSWKNAYARKVTAKIERNVSFIMNDEVQTKVSNDGIITAFKYGTTLVPFTPEDKQNMDYVSGEKGMKVLGFTKKENIHRFHYIGDKSMYVFGQKNRELAAVILAPFIYALHETNMVAIVRYVYSARSSPKIGFLLPRVKPEYECLVFIVLPFMEDLRHYIFSSLDTDSRNIPTDEQLKAVDDLITSMDLSTAVVDDEGNVSEALKPKYTVNPYLQRLYQCLHHRALHGEKPLPDIASHIFEIITPPAKLLKMAEPAMDQIKGLFPLKDVKQVKTKAGNIFESEPARKRPRLDDDSNAEGFDAVGDEVSSVGSVNPVSDFQSLLKSKKLQFGEACKEIIDVALKFLKDETNLRYYHGKIMDISIELRKCSLKEKNCALYNNFMKRLKSELLPLADGLWDKIRNEGITLISSEEVDFSTVSPEEAASFLSAVPVETAAPTPEESSAFAAEEDDLDLLDQL